MISVSANEVCTALATDGIVLLPELLTKAQLKDLQNSFSARLQNLRWNDVDGYELNERYRHMVQDVLTLDQAFVDVALHPVVKDTLREYIGPRYELVEAKGWKSLPTNRDFHGWHGDAWYDQTKVNFIPREVKLAVYLTDVTSGFFEYVRGSHQKQAPRSVRNVELRDQDPSLIVQAKGPAGSAFLFDTSGIHRQSVPILAERHAIFLNYHDPSIPLQNEDVEYNRYHPLLLNAAFLGGLTEEDRRILGFGNKTNHVPYFQRATPHKAVHALIENGYDLYLKVREFTDRVKARMNRIASGK
jgi:hypothetical protein